MSAFSFAIKTVPLLLAIGCGAIVCFQNSSKNISRSQSHKLGQQGTTCWRLLVLHFVLDGYFQTLLHQMFVGLRLDSDTSGCNEKVRILLEAKTDATLLD